MTGTGFQSFGTSRLYTEGKGRMGHGSFPHVWTWGYHWQLWLLVLWKGHGRGSSLIMWSSSGGKAPTEFICQRDPQSE
jgi:hypothetical protein